MTVKARSRLSKSGYSAVAGWAKHPQTRVAATEFKAEFGDLAASLWNEAGEVDEGPMAFVVRLCMTVYPSTRVIGASPDLAEALDPAQAMAAVDARATSDIRELALSASQMASATKVVDVAASVVAQLQSNGVPIDSKHFPNVLAFLQLALCAEPADWDLSGGELARRIVTGAPVLFSDDGRSMVLSDHASTRDTKDADSIRVNEIRGPRRLPAPYAGGSKNRATTKVDRRRVALNEVVRKFPSVNSPSRIIASFRTGSRDTPGGFFRDLLGVGPWECPSPRTLRGDFEAIRSSLPD